MALDGLFLHSIVDELKEKLINGKIAKVNQPEKDEIVISVRSSGGENLKLLISASSTYPKIHFTNNSKPNPISAPLFNMVLRKYLNGAKILDIFQYNSDRIVIINFLSTDELGVNSKYNLIVEIMGRHSNITLVRERDNIIMDSIKHLTPDINSFRLLFPSVPYTYPPKSERLDPFSFNLLDFKKIIKTLELRYDSGFFSKVFTGLCKETSNEIYKRLNIVDLSFEATSNFELLYNHCQKFFDLFREKKYNFNIYNHNNLSKGFYCIDLSIYNTMESLSYKNGSELLENYYFLKDKGERLSSKFSNLSRLIQNNLDRCNKKQNLLDENIVLSKEKDILKLHGELLTANIYKLKPGLKEISVENYYSETYEPITITLKENKTPSENIQTYFKKYNKLKKSEENAYIQKEANGNEITYLLSVMNNLHISETYEEIDEIKDELLEQGYIKFSKKNIKKKKKQSKPYHFSSTEGYEIYVGKNNIQNDFLTLKFASKQDIWLHTKDIPGSHVIIKRKAMETVPEETILMAANLAAFYSKGKTSSKVPVDYTEVRNVKKPSGSKPGMVIYTTNKTIYITPTEPK